MRYFMRKLRYLNIRRFAVRLTKLDEYLGDFMGCKQSKNMVQEKANCLLVYIMPNIWSKKSYLKGFDFEVPFKKTVNMI